MANNITAQNITSSFSYRVKTRRKPFNWRNVRYISFLRLYKFLSYTHGSNRLDLGGTTGVYPSIVARWRVSLPS